MTGTGCPIQVVLAGEPEDCTFHRGHKGQHSWAIPTTDLTPDAPACYAVTRLSLVEALRNVPLTSPMHLEALVKMADALLVQMPAASGAGFYMEGVKAERERIRQAAQERFDALGEGDFSQAAQAVADILLIVGEQP